jgi:hypothetical protein
MNIFNQLFNWFISKRLARIENFMKNPYSVQENLWKELIVTSKNTEWGKKHDFSSSLSLEAFRQRVPISTYEELYPFIERMLHGEQNVLWHTPITHFSKSSGTTNARSKFIPVSKESLETCHYCAGKDMLAIHVQRNPKAQIFKGKNISIGGSFQENPFQKGSYVGDVSAILMKNLPWWVEFRRSPKLSTALMSEWEAKIAKMAEETSKEDITAMAGVPTWTMVLLQKVLEITGKQTISEVWQNLEVFWHGAVAFSPYRQSFQKLIGSSKMQYMEIYNASEGFFGIQDTFEPDEMLLLLDHGVYYEFVPLEEIEKDHPKAIGLEEVELNKNYAIIITTNSGLWRYKIGDVIKFTNKEPFRFKIVGRTKQFINAFGEELMVDNAEAAITFACQETSASIRNFSAAPIYLEAGKRGGHEWLIEFVHQPDDFLKFIELLDQKLRELNSDYDAKRYKDIALVQPVVHQAPEGTFYEWLKRKNKLGGQNKIPRLSNNREYIDEMLEVMKEKMMKF